MKYQCPELHPMDQSFAAYGACASGNQATLGSSCLSGVSATRSSCTQGIHPEFSCITGALPGNDCASGSADSEW